MDAVGIITLLVLVVFLGAIMWFAVRQQRTYSNHIAEVKKINDEIHAMNRGNHELARRHLTVLEDIKHLLENRKS